MSQSCKFPGTQFLPWQSEEEVKIMRSWGFNCVRLLLTWEALEPEPGRYDEAYLDRVAQFVDWCAESGIHVVLDMHQDLYGRKYGGNGCPAWSCVDDGIAFKAIPGHWAMNYGTAAVIRAFDNFWEDRPGPDGVGVQTRYILAWQRVAERFKDDPMVLGYDMMNEPFYGSAVLGIAVNMMWTLRSEFSEEGLSWSDLTASVQQQGQDQDPMAVLAQRLLEKDRFYAVLDASSRPGQLYEIKRLQPFYDRLGRALREVDCDGILFFEPAGGAGSGTRLRTAIDTPRWEMGAPMPNCVFAPHHYEFAAEMGMPYPVEERWASRSLSRTEEARERMGIPVWYGEWGAWNTSTPGIMDMVIEHLDFFDEALVGWAWWEYGPGFKDSPFLPLLTRPYAQVIAGIPTRMRCTDSFFELKFDPLPEGGETVIWVPNSLEAEVQVHGVKDGIHVGRDSEGFVRLTLPGQSQACHVEISLRPRERMDDSQAQENPEGDSSEDDPIEIEAYRDASPS